MTRFPKPQEIWISPIFKGWKEHTSKNYVGFLSHLQLPCKYFLWRNSDCWFFPWEGGKWKYHVQDRETEACGQKSCRGRVVFGWFPFARSDFQVTEPASKISRWKKALGLFFLLFSCIICGTWLMGITKISASCHTSIQSPFLPGWTKKKLWTHVIAFALSAGKRINGHLRLLPNRSEEAKFTSLCMHYTGVHCFRAKANSDNLIYGSRQK